MSGRRIWFGGVVAGGMIAAMAAAATTPAPKVPAATKAPAAKPAPAKTASAKDAPAKAAPKAPPPPPGPDPKVLATQVILDRLGFSPGVVDGRAGFTLKLALSGFQTAQSLPVTGELDPATAQALGKFPPAPAIRDVTLTAADLAGPFVGAIPMRENDQAELPSLGYSNALEMLGERYHTTPATLIALNSPDTKLAPGTMIHVPNVVNWQRDYPANLHDDYKQTLAGLNIDAHQPQAAKLVVDKSDRSLSVYDENDKLVAQFPVTTGSKHDPLPVGTWKILGLDQNPEFHFNPKLFWDAKRGDKAATLPPGPNGPVGIVWIDLNKPHYGIHGTPEPKNIGRTESHGCIRLTNWDAGRLSLMVKPGTPAIFQP